MHEIVELRRRNEILSAKVEMIDLFACVLHTSAAYVPCGEGLDVVVDLQREIEILDSDIEPEAEG